MRVKKTRQFVTATVQDQVPGARPTHPIVVVLGPTATGKTRLGVFLARRFDGEIVSADSRQVYRGLDIGSGKDLEEYGVGQDRIPVHLVDVVEPREEYHVHRFVGDAHAAIERIRTRGRLPFIVGGSGLYINALIEGYALEGGPPDPVLRERLDRMTDEELIALIAKEAPAILGRVDRTQRRRILRAAEIALTCNDSPPPKHGPLSEVLLLGPYFPRRVVHQRIAERLSARLDAGLVEEVRCLHDHGVSWDRLDSFGLEYRWTAQYLRGLIGYDQFRESLFAAIRRLAKRQDVWYRKIERQGRTIHWVPDGDSTRAALLVERFLRGIPLPAPEIRLDAITYDSHGNARSRKSGRP